MIKHCAQCEKYLAISDGYGLCNKDALPVMVISDYEPTKNFLQCQKTEFPKNQYGEMPYQADEKTPQEMFKEGWCNGCEGSAYQCERNGRCEGYVKYKENKE